MSREARCDIAVIGGGPAGSAVALRLAALGHDVCLLERRAFPRRHVGEALSAGVGPQLEFLGVSAAIERAGFLRFAAARVRWSTDRFEHRPAHAGALTVDRGRFDHILLAAARRVGVRVWQPATARRAARSAAGWRIEAETGEGPLALAADFVIDATGRSGFLPRQRVKISPRTIALYGYWGGARLPTEPRIEAGERQWYWGSPVPGCGFNAMVLVDADDRRRAGKPIAARYRALIGESSLLAGARAARLESPVFACDATCYCDAFASGPGYLKVGEASFAIDPLSSTGVQKAIQTALAAAVVAHTILLRPAAADTARAFYRDDQRHSVAQHAQWSAESYGAHRRHADREFWRRRARPDRDRQPREELAPPVAWSASDRVALSPRVAVRDVPCLVGDFVEAHPAVTHPALARPVSFVEGVSLAELLGHLRPGVTASEVGAALSRRLPVQGALRLLDWLIQNDLLRPLPQP